MRDIGDKVKELIPSAKIAYTGEVGADPRNYRVKFDLLNKLLPDFKLQYDLSTGMEELHRKLIDHGFGKKGMGRRPVRSTSYFEEATRTGLSAWLKSGLAVDGIAFMIFTPTPLPGAYLIDLEKKGDDRGFFARAFCENEFRQHDLVRSFLSDE